MRTACQSRDPDGWAPASVVPVTATVSNRPIVGSRGACLGAGSAARLSANSSKFVGGTAGGVMVLGMPNSGDWATPWVTGSMMPMMLAPTGPKKGSVGTVAGPAATGTATAAVSRLLPLRGTTTMSMVRIAGLGCGWTAPRLKGLRSKMFVGVAPVTMFAPPSPRTNEGSDPLIDAISMKTCG